MRFARYFAYASCRVLFMDARSALLVGLVRNGAPASTRLPKPLMQIIQSQAEARGTTSSAVIREALIEHYSKELAADAVKQ